MTALSQPVQPETVQDHLSQAGLHLTAAVQMLSASMQQTVATAQVMQQVQMILGQGNSQPATLDSAAAGLQSDMQASAAQQGSY